MKTSFNPNFVRDLRKTKEKSLRGRLAAVIKEIEAAEALEDVSNLKKLDGFRHAYRIRIGEYRVGLYYYENEVELMRFLHRKDIYRKFP